MGFTSKRYSIIYPSIKVNKERELRLFFETLENKPQLIDTWDENLWITLVEKMEVSHDKECEVFFKNGVSVKVNI